MKQREVMVVMKLFTNESLKEIKNFMETEVEKEGTEVIKVEVNLVQPVNKEI